MQSTRVNRADKSQHMALEVLFTTAQPALTPYPLIQISGAKYSRKFWSGNETTCTNSTPYQESWSVNETTCTNSISYLTVIRVQGRFLLLWFHPWFQWESMWHQVSSERFECTSLPKSSWSPQLCFPRSCSYWWESEHTLHASCTETPEENRQKCYSALTPELLLPVFSISLIMFRGHV